MVADNVLVTDRRGVPTNAGEQYDYIYPWQNLGSLNKAIVTPAFDERDNTSIQALVTAGSVLELLPPNNGQSCSNRPTQPNGAISYEIANSSDGGAGVIYKVDILVATAALVNNVLTPGHYTRRATITGTQGLQVANNGFFHDSVVGSNEAWLTDPTDVPETAQANYIGSYLFNVHGAISIVFVPVTLPSGTLYIGARRFS